MSELPEIDHLSLESDKADSKAEPEEESNKSMESALQSVSNKSSLAGTEGANSCYLDKFENTCPIDSRNPSYEGSETNEKCPILDGFSTESCDHSNPSSSMSLCRNANCCSPSDPVLINANRPQGILDICYNSSGKLRPDNPDVPNPRTSTSGATNNSDSILFVDTGNPRMEDNSNYDSENYENSSTSNTESSSALDAKYTTESSGIGSRFIPCSGATQSVCNTHSDENFESYDADDIVEPSKFKRRSFYRKSFDEIQIIGKGSFGSVYEVKHKIDNHIYAVKCVHMMKDLDEETIKKEAKTLAKFHHQNIVRYYNSWIDASSSRINIAESPTIHTLGVTMDQKLNWTCHVNVSQHQVKVQQVYLIANPQAFGKLFFRKVKYLCIQMELCKRTLKDWLKNIKVNELEMNRHQIIYQISVGLVYIHSQNYIHRDLKPANIFFASDGNIKIGDFGLVTSWKRDGSDQFCRSPETGTRLYMAPEQMSEKYNHKVDIYSLGLILFELMSPILLFGTNHEKQKVWAEAKICNFPIEFTREFPKEAEQLNTMLNADPMKRPDALQVQNVIQNLFPE